MRIGHTTMPTKRFVVCYECEFEFQVVGKAGSTLCPKCRTSLEMIDYTIDSEWTDTLKTAGTITLAPEGVLKSGELVGQTVILKGRVEEGTLRALGRLEVHPDAKFPESLVEAVDLTIVEGATVTMRRKGTYRNVEVAGTLKAKIVAEGEVIIRAGGFIQGSVTAQRLTVEEGGGLKGQMKIEPPEREGAKNKVLKSVAQPVPADEDLILKKTA